MSKPQHFLLPHFSVRDGQLVIAGKTVSELKEVAGRTPFYAYDTQMMTTRVEQVKKHLPEKIALHYAIKANPHPAVIKHMASLVQGLDVASGREMALALGSGIPAHEISFAGPGKSENEIRMAVGAGVVLNIESKAQLLIAQQMAEILNKPALISLRINPDFELKSSGMKMGGYASPFGIDVELVPEVLAAMNATFSRFEGFHVFWGSQNLRAENVIDAQKNTFALLRRLLAMAPAPARFVNIGGGLGIPYFPGDVPLDLASIGQALNEPVAAFTRDFPNTQIVMELGRYLVGEAGIYVCEVLEKKQSRGSTFLITNGGLHHHLAASGNFGQVIRKNYPVLIATQMNGVEQETVNVVGPLCTPLDVLASNMALPFAQRGDLVAVLQSGAYGLSASPRGFLSHPDAVELVL